MPAAVVVVAAAASGVAAAVGGAVVAGLAIGTVSAAAATAIGTGIIAGGITAIQGGSTSDVLKSAVLSGVGSYVGGQVASKVTNSVSAATGGTAAGSGLTPGAAGTTGLTAGSAGAGLTAGSGAASSFVTPTTIGVTAGAVAGRAVQAAITGQDIEEAALFGFASSIPYALNQSADFRKLDNTTKNVISSSAQAVVTGQDVPEAAVSALVQSSNIVARAINEIPGGNEFIRENPVYARYLIDSVSSALTAELLNKNVNDAVINSLARTTGQLLAQEFENSQRASLVAESKTQYDQLAQKERELLMVQEQMQTLQQSSRYAKTFKLYADAANKLTEAQDAYQSWNQQVSRLEEQWNNAPESERAFIEYQYKQAVDWANYFASVYNSQEPFFEVYRKELADNGYFKEFGKLEKQYTAIEREYNTLANSISATASELAKTSSDLFNATSNETLAEIERFASLEEPEIGPDVSQVAEGGMALDITGPRRIYETSDKSVVINEELGMFLDEDRTGDYKFAGVLTPEEFRDLTGRTVEQALASPTPIQDAASVEDIAGIPSFTGTPQSDLDALRFTVGVDLRKEASPQTNAGKAIYRPAETTGTTGTGGTSSTFQIIGRDSATGAEKVDVDGESFTLIALPNNKQALVKDVGEVILYVEKDPVTNDTVLREEPNPEIVKEIVGGGGGGATQAPAPETDRTGGTPLPSSQVLARQANERALNAAIEQELTNLERELQEAEQDRFEVDIALQRALSQTRRFGDRLQSGGARGPISGTSARLSPETQSALEEEIRALESQLAESSRQIEDAAAERERFGALQQRTESLSDEDILSFLESGEIPGGGGEGEPGAIGGDGGDQEGIDGGAGGGRGGGAGSGAGDGTGAGAGGGEGDLVPDITLDEGLPQATVTLGPEFAERPGTTPFGSRVTGEALEGILGEKEPLFGGDDDEQRAVWNRRSLRLLSRALGL